MPRVSRAVGAPRRRGGEDAGSRWARPGGLSTWRPRRCRDPSSRTIHVAAAAVPRPVFAEYSRPGRGPSRTDSDDDVAAAAVRRPVHGLSTWQPRRCRDLASRNIHVPAAARLRGLSASPAAAVPRLGHWHAGGARWPYERCALGTWARRSPAHARVGSGP